MPAARSGSRARLYVATRRLTRSSVSTLRSCHFSVSRPLDRGRENRAAADGRPSKVGSVARRPAAGGGHWVDVDPERLDRWLAGFAERNGPYTEEDGLRLRS